MGHDIHAYVETVIGESERFEYVRDDKITYLRRGARNSLAREIYTALRCPELDGGVSGMGTKAFCQHDLEQALDYLHGRKKEGLEVDPEIALVEACLSTIAAGIDEVIISFG